MSKPKLHLVVKGATHFLNYELPYFRRYFEIVPQPGPDVIVFAYGPDVFDVPPTLPARLRAAYIFLGFSKSPYYDLELREHIQRTIDESYDVVFTNPGPLTKALRPSDKLAVHDYAIKVELAKHFRPRTAINSLIHISGEQPQKDSGRSKRIMELTGLPHEIFPPRRPYTAWDRRMFKLRRWLQRHHLPYPIWLHPNYVRHGKVIKKYLEYDGFVHRADP